MAADVGAEHARLTGRAGENLEHVKRVVGQAQLGRIGRDRSRARCREERTQRRRGAVGPERVGDRVVVARQCVVGRLADVAEQQRVALLFLLQLRHPVAESTPGRQLRLEIDVVARRGCVRLQQHVELRVVIGREGVEQARGAEHAARRQVRIGVRGGRHAAGIFRVPELDVAGVVTIDQQEGARAVLEQPGQTLSGRDQRDRHRRGKVGGAAKLVAVDRDEGVVGGRRHSAVDERHARCRCPDQIGRRVSDVVHPAEHHGAARRSRQAGETVARIEVEGREIDPIVHQTEPRARGIALDVVERQVERVLVESRRQIRQGR